MCGGASYVFVGRKRCLRSQPARRYRLVPALPAQEREGQAVGDIALRACGRVCRTEQTKDLVFIESLRTGEPAVEKGVESRREEKGGAPHHGL